MVPALLKPNENRTDGEKHDCYGFTKNPLFDAGYPVPGIGCGRPAYSDYPGRPLFDGSCLYVGKGIPPGKGVRRWPPEAPEAAAQNGATRCGNSS